MIESKEIRFAVGDVVGWTLSDGGQDDGRYEVVESHGAYLCIRNQHGKRFFARYRQCWSLDDD